MALNPASHNPTGEKTGPVTGPPPQASAETMSALLGAAKEDPVGQHESGQAGNDKGRETKASAENEHVDPS